MKGLSIIIMGSLITSLSAKDFGIQGQVHEVVEVSPVEIIEAKLSHLKETGEYEKFQAQVREKMRTSVTHPKPLEGWRPTSKLRTFVHDPTFVVPRDIKDHKGRLLAKKECVLIPWIVFP